MNNKPNGKHRYVVRSDQIRIPQERNNEVPAPNGCSGRTALEIYLEEIGKVKLITPEKEVELAFRIKRGDDSAREHMITANLRLVVKIAKDYRGLGVPLLDLINEGNIGLMKAVAKFDPAKGAKLSTYGSWWIRQQIKRALANQSNTIRLPIHVVDNIYHIGQAELRLREILGRDGTDEEVAKEVELPTRRVIELRRAAMRPTSFDAPLNDAESDSLQEIVEDERFPDASYELQYKNTLEILMDLMKSLDNRESNILRFRFGLNESRSELTLEQVGKKFGVTHERIRQIEKKALQKLRNKIDLANGETVIYRKPSRNRSRV